MAKTPKMFDLVRNGILGPKHFDKLTHKRLISLVSKIINDNPSIKTPISPELVADYVFSAADAGELDRMEEERLLDAIAEAWTKEVVPGLMDEAYVRNFVAIQETKILLRETEKAGVLSPDSVETARMRMESIASNRSVVNLDEISGNMLFDDNQMEELLRTKVVKSQSELLRTGIPSVDRALGGGLPFGKTAMVCAYTGVGKTVYGINMAWNGAVDGHGSVVFTLEMPMVQIQQRIFAKITRTPISWITKGRPDSEGGPESVIRRMVERYREMRDESEIIASAMSKFLITDFSVRRPVTARDIESACDALEQKNGFAIRNVVVDWIDRVDPKPKLAERKDAQTRHLLGSVSADFEEMVNRRPDRFVWLMTQANDAGKTRIVRMQHTNESRAKNHPVSVFFGLGTTEQGRANGIWTLNVDKNRDGPQFCLDISANMDMMEFGDAPDPDESLTRRR